MTKILIIGNPQRVHVGAHFLAAADTCGYAADIIDTRNAWQGPAWRNKIYYHALGKRPTALRQFGQTVIDYCKKVHPEILLVTGIAPLSAGALKEIGKLGVKRCNFLTDDPWNKANGARFFWSALREYDLISSPRTANLKDLQAHGCGRVEYLPFAYNKALHFFDPPKSSKEIERFSCDVALIGGADKDRLPLARAMLQAGLDLKVYGGYWEKHSEFSNCYSGCVAGRELRMAVAGATVNLCMGRRANRDGHAMRSLELPAMGGCVLVEKTEEHIILYGDETNDVSYYSNIGELATKARELAKDKARANQQAMNLMRKIREGGHTYDDRLIHITDALKHVAADT